MHFLNPGLLVYFSVHVLHAIVLQCNRGPLWPVLQTKQLFGSPTNQNPYLSVTCRAQVHCLVRSSSACSGKALGRGRGESCNGTAALAAHCVRVSVFQVHRLVIVNKQQEVVGVVSLSDILKFLVLREKS